LSHNLLTFRDTNGRLKKAKSIKLIEHQVRDAINNTMLNELWVEIRVVGKVRGEWTEYMPLHEFIKLNPELAERLSGNAKIRL